MAEQDFSTEADSLVLEPEDLVSSDLLTTLDIVSEQGTLGEDAGKFRVVDGRVSIGQPLVYKLPEPKPSLLGQRSERSHFYLAVFRFTLHPPESKRRYQEMKLEIKLLNPKALAFNLMPTRVTTEEDVNQSFDIGFSITPSESLKTSIGANAKRAVTFKKMLPIIQAGGDGESDFYWLFSKPHGVETVEPGSRKVAAVIRVPDEAHSLSATIQWQVSIDRSFLGSWRKILTSVEPITVNLSLI